MNKSNWLEWAEVIDALRIFPRLLLLAAFGFVVWYAWFALQTVLGIIERLPATADATMAEMIAQNIAGGTGS